MNKPISYPLAKLLKEKGFDSKIRGRIHVSHWHLVKDNIIPSNVNTYHTDMFAPIDNWNSDKSHFMSLPTIADVVMWLYEKHKIWISVDLTENTIEDKTLMFQYIIHDIKTNIKYSIVGVSDLATECYEKAIEYTLTKLI